MDTCLECGATFGRLNPPCGCRNCRNFRVPGRAICLVCCCLTFYPNVPRTVVALDTHNVEFLCLICFHAKVFRERCTCCMGCPYDEACCNHQCCRQVKIRFRDTTLEFAYPRRDKEFPVGWLQRDESEAILAKTAPLTKYDLDPKGFTQNASRRFAAVEIEILKYKDASILNGVLDKWNCSVVHDGSILRNHLGLPEGTDPDAHAARLYSPFEINTSPACGNTLYDQLKTVCGALKESKAEVSLSCGIHVHVDCRDFGYQELQKLIKVYWIIEEALFASVHWSRYDNEFCRHCAQTFYDRFILGIKPDTKGLKAALIKGVYGDAALDPQYTMRNGSPAYHRTRADHYGRANGTRRNPLRYSALNLHSYFLRGTVESRIHHGSTNFEEIYGWAKLWVDLFDAVAKTPATQLESMAQMKRTEVFGALAMVDSDAFKRQSLDFMAVGRGIVLLRSLLPNESFQYYLSKLDMACKHAVIATKKVLPCQL